MTKYRTDFSHSLIEQADAAKQKKVMRVYRAAMRLVDRWAQGCTYHGYMEARMDLERACAAVSQKRKGERR